jgi:hypothetical protein
VSKGCRGLFGEPSPTVADVCERETRGLALFARMRAASRLQLPALNEIVGTWMLP